MDSSRMWDAEHPLGKVEWPIQGQQQEFEQPVCIRGIYLHWLGEYLIADLHLADDTWKELIYNPPPPRKMQRGSCRLDNAGRLPYKGFGDAAEIVLEVQ